MTPAPSSPLSYFRLLQLVSPALPVGAYAYSQGLEAAVEAGWVDSEASLAEWVGTLLDATLGRVDVPLLARLHAAWRRADPAGV
nr:urease accessory protein UreF [Gammaproteobacteria bacterium]